MRIRAEFHPLAAEELSAAWDWYSARSPEVAAGFTEEVNASIETISDAPDRWPVGAAGTRRFFCRRYPYAVVYRVGGEILQIIAIAHLRRRPGYWKSRTASPGGGMRRS